MDVTVKYGLTVIIIFSKFYLELKNSLQELQQKIHINFKLSCTHRC